ncbi:MAG: HipA N-terminal domain-containing protein [Paludibacteraceae bacterium]|nr:HipA N-terminal domain-containing protein [Paludibacteraceae bacterium]
MNTIYVYFDDFRVKTPVLVGRLFAQQTRGKEIFSFEFEQEWLQTPYCRLLYPDLQLYKGRQFLADDKTNFGIFTDSAPDRWGRVLQERRESLRAKEEQRVRQILYESDFLLGVNDFSNALDFGLAVEVAPYFGVTADNAVKVIAAIKHHVAAWRKWATHYNIPRENRKK